VLLVILVSNTPLKVRLSSACYITYS
jgi:hypothetical protein